MKLITIAIPTYNRSKKIDRLLSVIIKMFKDFPVLKSEMEILLSDDSTDGLTNNIIGKHKEEFNNLEIDFTYVLQEDRLGMDQNLFYVYSNSKTEYVWYFADDDVMYVDEVIPLLEDIKKYRAGVIISSFVQPPFERYENRSLDYMDNEFTLIENFQFATEQLMRYPKMTAYVVKKLDSLENDSEFQKLKGSYFLFMWSCLKSFYETKRLLVRKVSIAYSDEDYLNLQYSPRVFENISLVENIWKSFLEKNNLTIKVTDRADITDNLVMDFYMSHFKGDIKINDDVFKDDEIYFAEHFFKLSYLWTSIRKGIVKKYFGFLISYYLYKRKIDANTRCSSV